MPNQDPIDNATILVIGASGGIGSAVTRRLADRGYNLLLAARNEGPLNDLAGSLEAAGRVETLAIDGTDFEQVQNAVKSAGELGPLVGAVNLVGSILLKPAQSTKREEFDETIALNAASAFALVRAASRPLGKLEGDRAGSIVLMSSCAASCGLPNHELIAAAKGAVEGLTRAAAATLAPRVRVNAVAPGLIDTPLAEGITGNEAARAASIAMHPLDRLGQPGDVAPAIEWLLTPESSFTTGQVVGVDGGLARVRGRVKASAR